MGGAREMERKEIKVNIVETKSVMTKSNAPLGGYAVNPYVGCPHACQYCYASFMKRFTGHTEEWGTFLDVKHWPDIKNPKKYAGQRVVIGSVTDGYNPQEERFCNTRKLLEQLVGSDAEILICTKSDLVLRDLDLLKKLGKVTVSWSINTLDEDFKNDMDSAVSIERRIAAMKQVYDAGIRTVCFVSPVFPGITDFEAIFECVKDQCDLFWLENLNLRGSFKKTIMDYIEKEYPDLVPLYDEIYNKHNRSYFEALERKAKEMAEEYDCPFVDNEMPYGRVMMKIVVLMGSPNRNGSTGILVQNFQKGAEEAGHSVDVIDVCHANIHPCIGCVKCGYEGPCVQKDDVELIRKKLLASDMIVFATPLYYYGMSAQLKTVVDRFCAYNSSLNSRHLKSALLTVAWNADDWTFDALKAHYKTLVRYINFKDCGMVLGLGCGTPGMTKRSRYPKEAYQLGRSL
jgi:radical SAM mobile pair protein B